MRRGWTPGPVGIDDHSGFLVRYSDLKRQWDGAYSTDPDKRNPQDFLKARPERATLEHPRPEANDTFFADNLLTEDGQLMICEDGSPLFAEGPLNGAGL